MTMKLQFEAEIFNKKSVIANFIIQTLFSGKNDN